MKSATCPRCGARIWVPAYEGDGAPPHYCEHERFELTADGFRELYREGVWDDSDCDLPAD